MSNQQCADLSLEFNRHIVNLIDSLSAISELTTIPSGQIDEADLLRRALEALMSNQDMERCSIFLLDSEGTLTNAAGRDWDDLLADIGHAGSDQPTPRRRTHYRLGEGIMGRAAQSGVFEHCRSCADDPEFKDFGTNGFPIPGSLICMPIVCESHVLGVLNVFYPEPGFFDLWHERLLLLFCQTLGRILVNHRLTHQLGTLVEQGRAELMRTNAELAQEVAQRRQAQEYVESLIRDANVTLGSLAEAQRIAHTGSWEYDPTDESVKCSVEALHIFEIDPATFDGRFATLLDAIHAEDRESVRWNFAQAIKNHRPLECNLRLPMADGRVTHVHLCCETRFDAAGMPLRSSGTVQDVTERMLTEVALRESEDRFRTIADYTYDWEYWHGPQREFLYISPSCERVSGYTQSEFILDADLLVRIVHPDDRALMERHIAEAGDNADCEIAFRIVTKQGDLRWIAHGCRAVHGRDGSYRGRRASNRDITELKNAEEQVRQLAYFDTLTGLPNRRLLLDRLRQALTQARRHGWSLALMFLDLDHFKHVNDSLGHQAGDDLLKTVAARLETCVRAGDTVCRQGGDEFVVLLGEIGHPDDAAIVAGKILKALTEAVPIGNQNVTVGTSIGIAILPAGAKDDDQELLKKADRAMYAAKDAGRNCYRFFAADTP